MMQYVFQENAMEMDEIEHEVTQFVDNSNSTITFSNNKDIKRYITKYFFLLKIYYNMSKLKINDDKTNMMMINRPKHNNTVKDIQIKTDTDIIKQKEKFKILGWHQVKSLSYKHHLNQVASTISLRINSAAKFVKYMGPKARMLFANAHLQSHLSYGVPLFYDESSEINKKHHQIFMKCIRFAFGSYGFRKSTKFICKSVGKKESKGEAMDTCAKATKKIIQTKKPRSIINKIRFPQNRQNAVLGLV